MIHRPWPHTDRLVSVMIDSALSAEIPLREPRSGGLHASTLLKVLHPVKSTITERELRMFGLFGLAWEDRVERALTYLSTQADWPYECFRPGEVIGDLNGRELKCSPDILMIEKATGDVCEMSIKLTWKSCAGLPITEEGMGGFSGKFDYYMDQCMTYATPLSTCKSILFAGFVNGGYEHQQKRNRGTKTPPIPRVHGWELEFTEYERDETWQSLCTIADQECV
jgi:hypothetical protein